MNVEQMLQRILEKQEAIEVMLVAQAKAAKNYQWVEGYACGSTEEAGINGKRSVYVLLYGPGEHMQDPMVKVYPNDSRGLPLFIRNAVRWDAPDDYPTISSQAAKKAKQVQRGKFVQCPRFAIIRWDGKETQMGPQKMLGGVVHWTKEAREAERRAQGPQPAQAQPRPEELLDEGPLWGEDAPEQKVIDSIEHDGSLYVAVEDGDLGCSLWTNHKDYMRDAHKHHFATINGQRMVVLGDTDSGRVADLPAPVARWWDGDGPKQIVLQADQKRDGIVAELWTLFPAVYKKWKAEAEKIASGVSNRTDQLNELTVEELAKVRAIVLLDKLGLATYKEDWYAILGDRVGQAGAKSVYGMPVEALRKLYGEVEKAGKPQTPQERLQALGEQLYANQWPQVLAHNVKRLTGVEGKDVGALTGDQLQKLIGGLEKLKEQRQLA